MTVVEFHSVAVEIQSVFLHPNKHSQRIFWYLAGQLSWELTKIEHIRIFFHFWLYITRWSYGYFTLLLRISKLTCKVTLHFKKEYFLNIIYLGDDGKDEKRIGRMAWKGQRIANKRGQSKVKCTRLWSF